MYAYINQGSITSETSNVSCVSMTMVEHLLSVNKLSQNMTSIASCLSMTTSLGASRLATCSHLITVNVRIV